MEKLSLYVASTLKQATQKKQAWGQNLGELISKFNSTSETVHVIIMFHNCSSEYKNTSNLLLI